MSSRQANTTESDLRTIAEAIRDHDRFLVTTHENPDGDALGSLLAAKLMLDQLGKDVVTYLAGQTPLPREYQFMELGDLLREPPADTHERVLFALDCANERRLGPDPSLYERAPLVIDIDHHHDNSRFGQLNYIDAGASSTGEIMRELLRELGVELTPELAEAGADVHRVFQGVYENVAFAKLKLVAKALEHARVYDGGRVIVSHLEKNDFEAAGAEEPYSEGIIDYLRAVEGAEIAALIRQPPTGDGPARRVSLRTTAEGVDVSKIARKSGGGGHPQAAGFPSEATVEEITNFIRRESLAQVNGARRE